MNGTYMLQNLGLLKKTEYKTYGEREVVEGMYPCMKRPITVHAKQIDEPFRVNTMGGNYKQGKSGDYLMRGIEGELYICDRDIFERSYDWTDGLSK